MRRRKSHWSEREPEASFGDKVDKISDDDDDDDLDISQFGYK